MNTDLTYQIFKNYNGNSYRSLKFLRQRAFPPPGDFKIVFDLSFTPIDTLPKFISDLKENILQVPNFDKSKNFIFLNDGEGYASDDYFNFLHELISIFQLTGKVFLSNCSTNLSELYFNYCKKENISKRIECIFYKNHFENVNLSMDGYTVYSDNSKKIKLKSLQQKKLFCNFNMRDRNHRFGMIATLNYFNLIKENYISSPIRPDLENPYNFRQDWNCLIVYSNQFLKNSILRTNIIDKLDLLKLDYPLRVDDRSKYDTEEEAITDSKICEARKQSLFELISETHVYGTHFFSEKTFIPIYLQKPFFMFNGYNALESLKKLGYMTFHPIIDESYDKIEDDAERCIAIAKEIKRQQTIRKENPNLFYKNYDRLLKICYFNYNNFIKK